MLFLFELKKLLLTKRGIWILLICLFLKAAFLLAFPEQIDSRIRLSRKQYDRYLETFYGEDTEEKNRRIQEAYTDCKSVLSSMDEMIERYQKGEITEEKWRTYSEAYDDALLHINALEIFYEKAVRFSTLEKAHHLPEKPCYMDESGWQTIYTLLKFPDLFLLAFILVMAVQAYTTEVSSGMLPVLQASSRGREELYLVKACVLAGICLLGVFAGNLVEYLVFYGRGFFQDGDLPLYSITIFGETAYQDSLLHAYTLCLTVRAVTFLAFALFILGLSAWIRNSVNLIIVSLLLLLLPFLFSETWAAVFTYPMLLSGSRMLQLSFLHQIPVWLSACETVIFSLVILLTGMAKQIMLISLFGDGT